MFSKRNAEKWRISRSAYSKCSTLNLILFFSNCWRSWQSFPSLLNLWKFPFFSSLHSLYTPSSLPWQWCYSESPPHLPPPQHRQEGTRERGRERQRDIYREREGDRDRGGERALFPWKQTGGLPNPHWFSTGWNQLGANRVSVSRLSLSSLFCSSYACAHKHTQVLVKIQVCISCHWIKLFILRFVLCSCIIRK